MTTTDVTNYYANLLILQYLQQPRAYATVQTSVNPILLPDYNQQTISFVGLPASGNFKLQYNGIATALIAWNASAGTIQTDLNATLVAPLTSSVSGSIATGLTITFSGYTSSVQVLSIIANTLFDIDGVPVLTSIIPIGTQLPFEVQGGFNLIGSSIAVGVQLDTLGKYVGVTRSGNGFNGPITLDDADFLTLIQMAIIRNKSGSSLATIQALLNQFFAGEIFVFDYANMNMSYLISTTIGSQDLIDLFVTEGLLPRPMGVGLSVIAAPIITMFFAFRTYSAPASTISTPFNSYASYQTSWLFMTYADSV